MSPRRTAFVVGAIAVLGLALRMLVLARPVGVLDRLFIPDDTYYTLTIARSLAAGHGPTVDGSTFTSGFQPLLGFLLVPVYRLTDDLDLALRADLALLVVADVITIVLLARVAHRLAGSVAAIVAALVWAVSPIAVGMAIGGLETSLAMACEIGLVAIWMWANDAPSTRRWAVVGIVGGLAVLARIDALALLGLLAAVQLWRGGWRPLVPTATAAAAVLAPWWIWCTWQLGTPLPTSGEAAHALAGGAPFATRTFAHAAAAVVGGPFTQWNALRNALVDHPAYGLAVFLVVVAALLALGAAWSRTDRDGRTEGGPSVRQLAAALPVFAAVLLVFYVWFGVTYYFTRYLAPVAMVATLMVAFGVARLVAWVRSTPRVTRARLTLAAGAGIALLVVVAAAGAADLRDLTADDAADAPLDARTGFGALRAQADASLPTGAVVGAWQSGALGYYAADRLTVVNLDGVVNPDAPQGGHPVATARYVRHRRIAWLADWGLFLLNWQIAGAGKLHRAPHADVVSTTPAWPGADTQFTVWHVIDPAQVPHPAGGG